MQLERANDGWVSFAAQKVSAPALLSLGNQTANARAVYSNGTDHSNGMRKMHRCCSQDCKILTLSLPWKINTKNQ